jgi:dynein heavy chain
MNVLALAEADDITLHLKPLRRQLESLEEGDYTDVSQQLAPMMNTICLVWANSKYYCQPPRIIVLLQEIGNLIIELVSMCLLSLPACSHTPTYICAHIQYTCMLSFTHIHPPKKMGTSHSILLICQTRNYLGPDEIFKAETDEAKEKVTEALKVCNLFRELYDNRKSHLADYYKDQPDAEVRMWDFDPQLVFARYTTFLNRLSTMEELFTTILEFSKLEKVDFTGIKGSSLFLMIEQLFKEFEGHYKVFAQRTYDPLDPQNGEFMADYKEFCEQMFDLDSRLAAVAGQAFDDCSGPYAVFKLIDMFGSLMDRPLIHEQFVQKMPFLIAAMNTHLDHCKELYDQQMKLLSDENEDTVPMRSKNMPVVSGTLRWSQELRDLAAQPIMRLKGMNHGTVEGAEAMTLFSKFDEMTQLLVQHDQKVYEEWAKNVDEMSKVNLRHPLLVRSPDTKLISVNFDPQLVSTLREVKYLELRDQPDESIPEQAAAMFSRNETYRKYLSNLDLTVAWYNKIRDTILDVELPLIADQLQEIDSQLEQALTTLTWDSDGVWEYIEVTRDKVHDLEQRVQSTKTNVETISQLMAQWAESPLFERKDGKKDTLLSLEDRETRLSTRHGEIKTAGDKIHQLVSNNLKLFKADETTGIWKSYVEYLDDIVLDGFFNAVHCSLSYLLENTDASKGSVAPLLEAKLELQVPDLVFSPSLEYGSQDGFYELVEGLVQDVFHMASLIPRLAKHNDMEHYQVDVEDMLELSEMKGELMDRCQNVITKALEFRNSFDSFSYLWVDDRQEFMRQFLLYNHVLTQEEVEQYGEEGVPENPPTLRQFKEQIDSYEKIHVEVNDMEPISLFDQWFQVDARPFKQGLLNIVKRWSYMFKQHLDSHVTTSLNDLAAFVKMTDKGLSRPVEEGDYSGLVECIGHLVAVRDRMPTTDNMFEPLKETIDLLKTYDQEIKEEVYLLLQELPEQWNNLKKVAVTVKQTVAPLHAGEVTIIRRKCASFDVKQHEFREKFRQVAPLSYNSTDVYNRLDKLNREVLEMEEECVKLQESATLFEVNTPDYKQLKACRREVVMLKQLWDTVDLVHSCIDDWKTTLWQEINVENMDIELKKFMKDIRALDKEMRAWDAFTGLDSTVKNMVTSLRAVGELQNPAIRDRHWQQLMQATKVRFSMSDETNLADLLSLNLHNFEEEVRNIVDKAAKELNMEKVLKELDSTWSHMEFEHEQHARTGLTMLKSSEELIETLEDNQVQLQNMITSKYIAFFLEEVSAWQKKLSTADSVINIWFEVQRTWSHLESIFIGSEDIRSQLPDDSKRFDGIDQDFKVLMADAAKTPNVVEATNKPNLYDKLEDIQKRLSICEKALAEYLETKRLAFPRFYFVSSADLLDILSKGNQPTEVARHLSKLFDNMAKLKFQEVQEGQESKVAFGMYSKENEYVDFDAPCECVGQVEVWLNRLMDTMRSTVRQQLSEAVVSYEEKPRDQWLFDYPAQVALTTTQIWWTTEVNIAFSRLEEGYENALKDYYKKQVNQLTALITMLLGDLSKGDRQKIMTICTIDVHARDVVGKMIQQKVENSQAFLWLSQLRHRWDDAQKHCYANICDAQFKYSYEYLGNTARLVITPLTDRCYITLTQSLHLTMSGAPAGPAGTGKTETTKDLGRALGIMVYVFNCSEQMDYKSIGNIYKGLAQTGAWGCFDEFNRISIEVLSVVAVQVKTIQDAIRDKKQRFMFLGEEIKLTPTVGLFITMNPGYAGRTELPENLKALFRPCAMVVPDFELICEIMLVAEGFISARLLARKFITLYTLCRELLSKQDHYDWGLRAIKSVLVVAGALKRGDRGRPEDQVLMRALRDFNLPKIVSDDVPVFMGLIGDLFPALNVPRKRDPDFEALVKTSAQDLNLQPEDNFVLKVVQLEELLAVRHSVFVLGGAGTGKTQVIKTLNKTYQNQKRRPHLCDMNPKAVSPAELFGCINPATREWKDGLLSTTMRDLSSIANDSPKWIVLDGDIDPMWIESLNTVMDDNKVLTLASNERIPLTPSMRLVFEIGHLKYATPATVSRAGILFINASDVGWNPFVTSWIDKREAQAEKANLIILFDKYVPMCLDTLRTRFKKITPVTDFSMVQTLCYLLECLLTPQNTPQDCPKEWFELYFVFAAVWAFGGSMFQDQLIDYRVEFSKWWVTEFKTIKFPSQGTVFDYYLDNETKKFLSWQDKVPKFEFDPEMPLQAVLVHTAETSRYRFFMDLLMANLRPVMLVGNAGSGKTVLVQDKLSGLGEEFLVTTIPFNHYTTAAMLQAVMEKPLEKKAGRNYGPPGTKKLIYFIDDMNMPEVDTYGTVSPHTLIRQHLDYSHWYDRQKLQLKEIHNVQYVACMNPTAGSFTINPRLQRHFSVFAVSFPGTDALRTIYQTILSGHFKTVGISKAVVKITEKLVETALLLHSKVASAFLPTAIKFHYIFNLRDLSNIFQGLLFSTSDTLKQPPDVVKLWLHESCRVYKDKLVDSKDLELFDKIQLEVVKKGFEDLDEETFKADPLIICHFAQGIGEPKYAPVSGWEPLKKLLEEALDNYNEVNAVMNLELFEDAMTHVCRINRILESPRGNALLVGVGGSGKQSLTRLAAFVSNLEVFQITLRKGYSTGDLKADLAQLYIKAGVKNIGTVFLLTDAQVPDETFLVLINDLLASGEIPDLYADDELENVINGVRNEVKGLGLQDTRENCWKFFIDRVRRQLKVVLCFSPVGSTLRVRGRKFPAVVNCTCIDWFHEWPEEALQSVSYRFLSEDELIPPDLRQPISKFMAYAHLSVNESSKKYLANERRYNYTTPKSFLEQIKLYQNLLKKKASELQQKMDRLDNGLQKLQSTASQVDDLKAKLAAQEVELKLKNEAADNLIQVVGVETEKVSKEKEIADAEELKVAAINKEVSEKQRSCEEDLAKAEPALKAAEEALNTLNKNNLTELKSFGQPPPAVVNVTAGVMVLMAQATKIPKDRSWKAAKLMMAKVDAFLDSLINFDKENISDANLKAMQPYLDNPDFNPDFIRSKSFAAAGLCAWAINIVSFYRVFCDVEPKRIALAQANADLQAAQDKLAGIKAKIKELDENLADLTAKFEKATSEKLKCQQEAESTALTISLANRLVNGLASENVRWAESVQKFKEAEKTLPGDVLLITAFVSYVGCFGRRYRLELMEEKWIPYIKASTIQTTEGLDPLSLLVDDATIAGWNNEGLPSDRMSTENATIMTNCERWPLLIDPQLQGIKWVKNREGSELRVVRLGARGYLDVIERAVSNGECVLIENIGESVDPVLDPLLGRNTIKKGRCIKMGDKEVEYSSSFRLILHTKLANPHYKPEMQAQTTLINFTVTVDGLEDQLLADVVAWERPDLEETKAKLTRQQNEFKITLKQLEDSLLARLSAAGGNFLGDTALVENLETTKKTAAEIEEQVAEAKVTEEKINTAREHYRPAAARAAMVYFILNDLNIINPIYQFSLKAFKVVFMKAVEKAEKSDDVKQRVETLIDAITYSVFIYTTRGLFERDKIIFTAQVAFQVLLKKKDINPVELDFLLRFPAQPNVTSPVDFLSHSSWGGIKALSAMEEFRNLDRDIEGSAKRWKKFVESECPEKEKFPQEWKNKSPLQKLCMMRALRPDRMVYAVKIFVEEKLGSKYVNSKPVEFAKSYEESGPGTPIFFVLSPGVDPLKDVEALGQTMGFTIDNGNLKNISLGQGQEVVAEQALDVAAKEGHWVILQNIHLVAKWLSTLDKKLEAYSEGSHEAYRVYISAEPAASREGHIIPQGILEACIKITNEPPTGMKANLEKAFYCFNQDTLEMCARENEFKSILFSLCYFHAVVSERRKFGAQGWNRPYPFNIGDLTISVNVLYNYLEANVKVPWDDLRYLFGEIMYGGHITDDWDRRLCKTYLGEYIRPEVLEGEANLAPGFPPPPSSDFNGYLQYIAEVLPPESPYLYGLHPNAEIDVLTTTSENLFRTVLEMQPRDASGEGSSGTTREEKVKSLLDDVLEKLPEEFNVPDLMARAEDKTPYVVVAFQECERMNILTREMRRSLKELDLGLKGELTITSDMENLQNSLFLDAVPETWAKRAYPSLNTLAVWYSDLLSRIKELENWVSDFQMPTAVWLGGLFNPQSFLTAIMQSMARKNEWPLDKMCLQCDVSKKWKEDFTSAPREGAYIHSLYMEGARWDTQTGMIQDSKLKELTPPVPVIFVRAIPVDKQETKNVYECPVYKTKQRGPTFVWTFNLKTKEKPAKWIIAGVALLLSA